MMVDKMKPRLWLIVNSASGSYDATLPDRVRAMAAANDWVFDRVVAVPEDDLPDQAGLDASEVAMLAIHTGDGTINSAVGLLDTWVGDVLVLPGGTMNLLARALHGEADADLILAAALAEPRRHRAVTVIEGVGSDVDIHALVGLFAGPTTAWGDVRETLRRFDIGGLVEAVPRAISATFEGDQVRLAGKAVSYPAIYIEPVAGQLRVMGFRADGATELFEHGFAWLGGDFRDGPHDALGMLAEVVIEGGTTEIGLLVDGERGHTHSPLRVRAALSPLRFVTTLPE